MPSGLPCFLLDALGISDVMPSGLSVFFVLDVLSVYWILCPVGYLCLLFDALGIMDLMPSGLPCFFV